MLQTKDEPIDAAPSRVLIADDNPSVLAVMSPVVRFLGHAVVGTAINGKECFRRAMQLHPSLVMVDLKMPGWDGIETSEAILKHFQVPIIIVTGVHDEYVSERLKKTPVV